MIMTLALCPICRLAVEVITDDNGNELCEHCHRDVSLTVIDHSDLEPSKEHVNIERLRALNKDIKQWSIKHPEWM